MADVDGNKNCREAFGHTPGKKRRALLDGSLKSFRAALDQVSVNKSKAFGNVHFQPAKDFCGGLDATMDYYDMVHILDKKKVPDQVRTLFDHIGVDKNLTEALIQRVVKTGGVIQAEEREYFQRHHGIEIEWSVEPGHNTASKDKRTLRKWFGSPKNLERFQDIYNADYDVFGLEPIPFEKLH